jgi:hypothetical protein
VFKDNIYDSASRYILKKSEATLQWCSGEFGYDQSLKTCCIANGNTTYKKTKTSLDRRAVWDSSLHINI